MTFDFNQADQSDSTAKILVSNVLCTWPANSYHANLAVQSNLLIPGQAKYYIQQFITVLVKGYNNASIALRFAMQR